MEEGLKNRIILILSILSVVFLITNINSCMEIRKEKRHKEREIAQRMELEERINKFSQEKTNWENNLDRCQKELEQTKEKLNTTEKALLQADLINKSLKEELDKVIKLKEILEEDLKEALVGKTDKKK
ncbi:MAG: hypothetical protein N2Z79_05250 [Candidatus Omnitrophica bacterium]|nr:hypothetical protein [Candidatus Omnitrophota bacterium]